MNIDPEVNEFLVKHLKSIYDNDIQTYHASTAEDLTLYEWWVTPHRLEGIPFHDFMMHESARRGTSFGSESGSEKDQGAHHIRFDLANLRTQRYGEAAIASYTLLTSTGTEEGVNVAAHNESRVMVKLDGEWKVVHVHKSPAYQAPHAG